MGVWRGVERALDFGFRPIAASFLATSKHILRSALRIFVSAKWLYTSSMVSKVEKRRTKDQHYVPRLHLQHFCGESPKNMIWTYSKRGRKPRPSRVEETGFQKNYYSVRGDDGAYFDDIDNKLTEIENESRAPYRRLLSGELPEGQERANFAMFVTTSFARSPSLIRSYAEAFGRSAQLQMRMQAEKHNEFNLLIDAMERDTGNYVEDRDELFAFINDPSRYRIEVSEKRGLRAIGIADKLAPLLYERYWHVVEATGGTFLTSDNPVYRWVPRDSIHPIFGDGGFKNPRAEITFPLSSTRMLVISGVRLGEGLLYANSKHVWNLNRMRSANAEELIFADRKDDRISALVEEFKDERPRMMVDHDYARDIEVSLHR